MFFLRHANKNYFKILIELWPSPGLSKALSVKPGHNVAIQYLNYVINKSRGAALTSFFAPECVSFAVWICACVCVSVSSALI